MLQLKKIAICTLFIFLVTGCKQKLKVEVIEPVESDNEIAELNSEFLKSTSTFTPVSGAPSVWQSFETIFKTCVKSSGIPGNSLFSKYRLLYLGPNNPSYLGAVYSRNGVEPKTELTKWLSPEELNKFIRKGVNVPGCDANKISETFISVAVGGLPFTSSDTALKFILQNKDTMINSVGSWTVDYILTEDFIKFLNENSSNEDIRYYKEVMIDGKNVVAFKVVKITGFNADIISKRDITFAVDQLNMPVMQEKTTTGADSVLCSLRFNKINNRTIHVATDGEFYAFALVMKGKKLQ